MTRSWLLAWQYDCLPVMQADVGGFGASSKFAWHLSPVVGVDMGKRTTLGIGYRVTGMDYRSES